MDKIIERILEQSGDMALLEKLSALPSADLNSLLLRVFQSRAEGASPAALLKAFRANRFTTPSEANPAEYHLLEASLLELAQHNGIEPILLSPAAPLFSSAAFGSWLKPVEHAKRVKQ